MANNKKRVIRIAAVILTVLAAFLILCHIPHAFRWTGTTESNVNGVDILSELDIDIKIWPKLFHDPVFTGSVTLDGLRYVDIHIHSPFGNNPFIPADMKGSYVGNIKQIYDNDLYLRIERWEGTEMLTIYVRSLGLTNEATQGTVERIFEIPLK